MRLFIGQVGMGLLAAWEDRLGVWLGGWMGVDNEFIQCSLSMAAAVYLGPAVVSGWGGSVVVHSRLVSWGVFG